MWPGRITLDTIAVQKLVIASLTWACHQHWCSLLCKSYTKCSMKDSKEDTASQSLVYQRIIQYSTEFSTLDTSVQMFLQSHSCITIFYFVVICSFILHITTYGHWIFSCCAAKQWSSLSISVTYPLLNPLNMHWKHASSANS